MIKVYIVDDEKAAIDNLKIMMQPYLTDFEITGTAGSVVSAVKDLKSLDIDVLFLDVSLPDGTGFDILELLGNIDFKVVFFTAFEEYAIKAIKKSAFDYLLKPVLAEELRETFRILKNALAEKSKQIFGKKLAINTSTGFNLIEESEILYCQADNNYAHIILNDGEKLTISKPLKSLERVLDQKKFLRPHQSYILNLSSIKKYVRSESTLLLKNNTEIPVSKANRDLIVKLLGQYNI